MNIKEFVQKYRALNSIFYKSCKKFKLPKYSIKNGFDTFSKLFLSLYKFIKNSKSIFLFFKASIESRVSFIQPSFEWSY